MTPSLRQAMEDSLRSLRDHPYPGRGIVLGLSPDARHFVQVYWIMGRSPASRSRVLRPAPDGVRTELLDPSLAPDPSLLVYHPIRSRGGWHVVSNGDQTETVLEALDRGQTFASALRTRSFEPDPPHYTPRISGLIDLRGPRAGYVLSILKALDHDPGRCLRQFFEYETPLPGLGHCITTYAGAGSPLPPFAGEPWPVPTFDDPDETAGFYWQVLNRTTRVALAARFIGAENGRVRLAIAGIHDPT